MSQKFKKSIQIKFRDADPAGILFFGNAPALAHDCFEDFIEAAGISWQDWFTIKDHLVPIRHLEVNYLAPMSAGAILEIEASVASLGKTSFKMKYLFKKSDKVHAEVLMVHSFISLHSKEKVALPERVRQVLTPYLEQTP